MNMLQLRVKEKIWETTSSCSFYFENVNGSTLFYKPGQFLTFRLTVDGMEYIRSYSLCTIAVKNKYPGITVKRVAGGVVSNHWVDKIQEGDVVEAFYPAGVFCLDTHSTNQLHYFLLAAGSGITPLFSMLQAILYKEPNSVVSLIYANKDEENIIFEEKLVALSLQFPDRFTIVHILSKPSAAWQGFYGRLDHELLKNLLSELESGLPTRFFLCGPKEFMSMAKKSIVEMGYSNDAIKTESFLADKVSEVPTTSIEREKVRKVEIKFRKENYEIMVPEGMTILEIAQENGIKIPYSCTSGVCTACIATCVQGNVDISDSDALSANEIKQGYILTCVAKPLTDHVVIQID